MSESKKGRKKVAIVFIGRLEFQGRLLKQIDTLYRNQFDVTVFIGNINNEERNLDKFKFPIHSYEVSYDKAKIFSFFNQIYFCFVVARKIRQLSFDLVQCCGLATLLVGVFVKRMSKEVHIVYDSTELSIERYKGLKRFMWGRIQQFALKYCEYVIHAETHRAEYFKNSYNLPERQIVVIGNYPRLNQMTMKMEIRKPIRFIYLGIISKGRHYEDVVLAFSKLKMEYRLDIIGPGPRNYIQKITNLVKSSNYIQTLPPIRNEEVYSFLEHYDVGLAFYENTNLNNYYCAPNKIYDYIRAGLPVISNNYPGLVDVIEKNRIGVCVAEVTAESISKAIDSILSEEMFRNITDELKKKFSWEAQENLYCSIFAEVYR